MTGVGSFLLIVVLILMLVFVTTVYLTYRNSKNDIDEDDLV